MNIGLTLIMWSETMFNLANFSEHVCYMMTSYSGHMSKVVITGCSVLFNNTNCWRAALTGGAVGAADIEFKTLNRLVVFFPLCRTRDEVLLWRHKFTQNNRSD